VNWPSEQISNLSRVPTNQTLVVTEGQGHQGSFSSSPGDEKIEDDSGTDKKRALPGFSRRLLA
jgi:hypothetical protein